MPLQSLELLDCVCAGSNDTRPLPSLIIVVAHPDDEAIGLGARLPRYREATFVHLTDGAPHNMQDAFAAGCKTREEYAKRRREELHKVLLRSEIEPDRAFNLGFVDQEASFYLVSLTCQMVGIFRTLRPEVVITHPYEGGHPDHDAAAFGVHTAERLLENEGESIPVIVEMTSYHNHRGSMTTAEFLPNSPTEVITRVLTKRERKFKQRLFDTYRTQSHVLRHFPVAEERFRLAPDYNFLQAPHEGELYYERYTWGMSCSRWKELVQEAYRDLGLSEAELRIFPMAST